MADPVITPQQPTTSTPLHDAAYYQNQGAAAQQSGTAAQAAQTNADYLANKLAVLPMYGDPVGTYGYNQRADYSGMSQANRAIAYSQEGNPLILTWEGGDANHRGTEVYLTPQEYQGKFGISQEQAEQAKHTAAFSQPRNDLGALSPAAQAITDQYNATHYGSVGSGSRYVYEGITKNPFNPDSAAGIAWLVNKQGGSVGKGFGAIAYGEGYNPIVNNAIERSVVQTPKFTTDMLSGSKTVAGMLGGDQTTTVNVPISNYAQEQIRNAKVLVDYQTGEVAIYQQPYGHSIYNLVSGGSRNALESGMFTVGDRAETPYVTEQWNAGKYVLPSGEGMSRLGAEAYAGYVRPLDNRTLLTEQGNPVTMGRYADATNLANYVNPVAEGKAEAPGAAIPWSIASGSPTIQYMDQKGVVAGSAITTPFDTGTVYTIVSPKVSAFDSSVFPAPFKSASAPAELLSVTKETPPSGDWLSGAQTTVYNAWNSTPLRASLAPVIGSVGYGYAAPTSLPSAAADIFGGGTAGEFLMPTLESNPVGWGVGIGLAAVYGIERSGRLGLTGETNEFSVRSAGGMAADYLYRQGYSYAGGARQQIQDVQLAQNYANQKASDMVTGFGTSLMTIGQGIFRGSEGGTAARSDEIPAAIPAYSEVPAIIPKTGLPTQKPSIIEVTETPTKSGNANRYQNDLGNSYGNAANEGYRDPFGVLYPNPTPAKSINDYGNPTQNPVQNPTRNPFGVGNPFPVSNPNPTLPVNPYTFPKANPNTNPPKYDYNTNNPQQPQLPKTKIPDIILPNFGSFGGGGGGSGGGRRRRAAFMETFMLGLDISARSRPSKRAKSFISPKKGKARKKK